MTINATHTQFAQHLADLPRPKVYSYARWSTPEQAKGDSFRRQSEAAERWAQRHGLTLDNSLAIIDEGVSAYRGDNAADGGLARFMEACRRGLIEPGSFLLVESLDRLSRMEPLRAQHQFSSIVLMGVTIVTLSDDQEYSQERLAREPWALMLALMVAFRAHEESATKGRRVAAAWQEKRRRVRAKPTERMTARGPCWLVPTEDGGWQIDPDKAEIVRRVYRLTLAGQGEHSIAALFNAERVPVLGCGKHWHRSTVSKLLRSPAVVGTPVPGRIDYRGGRKVRVFEEPVPGAYPPVIAEADWRAVRALKDGKAGAARGRHAGRGVSHVLAGLARCPACGSTMTRVQKGAQGKGGRPKLVCTAAKSKAGCRYVSVPVADAEDAFLRNWSGLFADIPTASAAGELDRDRQGLIGSISVREDRLQELVQSLAEAPSVTLAQFIARIESELEDLRAELVRVEERQALADGGLVHARLDQLRSMLEPEDAEEPGALDREAVNALLKVLFAAVVIDYGTGRLRFQWRQGGESALVYAWRDAC